MAYETVIPVHNPFGIRVNKPNTELVAVMKIPVECMGWLLSSGQKSMATSGLRDVKILGVGVFHDYLSILVESADVPGYVAYKKAVEEPVQLTNVDLIRQGSQTRLDKVPVILGTFKAAKEPKDDGNSKI
jgi:hypothetical protein